MALKSLYQEKVDLEELVLHQKKLKSISTIVKYLLIKTLSLHSWVL